MILEGSCCHIVAYLTFHFYTQLLIFYFLFILVVSMFGLHRENHSLGIISSDSTIALFICASPGDVSVLQDAVKSINIPLKDQTLLSFIGLRYYEVHCKKSRSWTRALDRIICE